MRRVFGHYIAASWVFLGIFEASIIAAGCCLAFYAHFYSRGVATVGVVSFAGLLALAVIGLMHSSGLYREDWVSDFKRALWRLAILTTPIFALAVWTTGALAKHTDVPIYPYRWQWTGALTVAWLCSAICVRLLFRLVHRTGILTLKVVVMGTEDRAAELSQLSRECRGRFVVVGHCDPATVANLDEFAASEVILRSEAAEVVVSVDSVPLPWSALVRCRLAGVRVVDYLDFYERETRRIRLDDLRDEWLVLSSRFARSWYRERARRTMDVLLAFVGFIATAPVLLMTACAIKLEDGGAILYRQERIGQWGRPFTVLKFRSMREDAEHDGRPSWASEGDSRITVVGQVIRKLRIDELPQLWNVIKGEMTLIGPRPERPFFVRQFSQAIPFYDYRHCVRPGITGWAQVSFRYGASLEDTRRKLAYDLYYIKNRGLLLDIVILLRTMGVVLRGEGAR